MPATVSELGYCPHTASKPAKQLGGASFLHCEEQVSPSPWLGSHLLPLRGDGLPLLAWEVQPEEIHCRLEQH